MDKTETPIQTEMRLTIARMGGVVWRNNSGVAREENRVVRYGLCNDSAQLNARIKSSDLIGLVPITVTPEMIGRSVGVFLAIEAKKPDWRFNQSDKRACAQQRFIDIVRDAGGFAGFVQAPGDLQKNVLVWR